GTAFSPRLNKAILDVLLFYFSDEKIRNTAVDKKEDVLNAFKILCLESEDFRNSTETTTKSLGATSTRLSLWGKELQDTLRIDFQIPSYDGKRIKFSRFW
ncbi:MAG TPA: hypothetical protein VMV84_03605, partial [Dehalococcoidales bacterium]|nr:hypothetical protein [Dehalococcoidales bacterium]